MSVRLSPNHRPKPSGRKLAGRRSWRGLPISIENRVGDIRRGTNADGTPWETVMRFDYGYVRLTRGAPERQPDGSVGHDHIDVYLGPYEASDVVTVVRQVQDGVYVEDKVMLGFRTVEEALAAYDAQYDKPGFRGEHVVMTWAELAAWCLDTANWGLPIQKAIEQEIEKAKASRASWRKSVRKYEAKPGNAQKMRAKWAVQSAVRSGKLKKPEVCPRCKLKRPLQFHHTSYARADWLKGTWKCRACHVKADDSLSNRNGKMSRSVKRARANKA